MPWSRVGAAALWALFIVVAVLSGWLAIEMVGAAVAPGSMPVLTGREVAQQLATASPQPTHHGKPKPTDSSTAKPSSTATSTSSPRPTNSQYSAVRTVVRSVASRGGSVVASCTSELVELRSYSPAVGYRVSEAHAGPAPEAEVTFVSSAAQVTLQIECVSGVPIGLSEVDEQSGDDD